MVLTGQFEGSMASRVCCTCVFAFVAVLSASGTAQSLSLMNGGTAGSIEHVAGGSLAKSCGVSCISLLESLAAQLNATAEGSGSAAGFDLLKLVAGNVDQSLVRAKKLAVGTATSPLANSALQHRRIRGASKAFASENVPCATPAACAMKAMAANKCNYARVALQSTYNELNVATHVLGVLVSSLCGCVHTGHVSTCALRSLPSACTFPYTVYSKAFAGSVQVWEAVKAATKKCIIHRDTAIDA